ncbi:MAG: helix-turn-helix domain-containing protein [Treponema sp.]
MIKNPAYTEGQNKRIFSLLTLTAIPIFILFLCFLEYRIVYRAIADKKREYTNTVIHTGERLNFIMGEISRLSHILMINTAVQGFVALGKVEQGSADIQKIIDAQSQLSYIKSVHPAIEHLFVYSKKSDYLLEADNAFFDIDTMYSALFGFKNLNSGQWRSQYLRPVYMNKWMHETLITVNGASRSILSFGQTFPLQNPGANTGKLIILLKSSHFYSAIEDLFTYPHTHVYITDAERQVLFMRSQDRPPRNAVQSDDSFNTVHKDSFSLFTHTVNGKKYLMFMQPLKTSNTFLTVQVPFSDILASVALHRLLLPPLLCTIIFFCALYTAKLVLPNLSCAAGHSQPVQEIQPLAAVPADAGLEYSGGQEADKKMIGRILLYIEAHYSDPLLNLSQMAEDFNIKENFLYYFFRSRIRKTFAQYLEDFRLEKARYIIETDIQEPVHSLAEKCGYSNSQTFRRAFKKKYGLTPSEFKQKVLTENCIL